MVGVWIAPVNAALTINFPMIHLLFDNGTLKTKFQLML
jgi:hypothetical protein